MREQPSHLVESSSRRPTVTPHDFVSYPHCRLTGGCFLATDDCTLNRWQPRVDLQQSPVTRAVCNAIVSISILVLIVLPGNAVEPEADVLLKRFCSRVCG